MKRPLLAIILLTLVGALGSGAWLLGTEQGNQQLLRWAAGEKLRIGTFRGSLLTGLDLEALEYRDEQQHLTIQTLHLDWRPAALINGLLHIQQLQAVGIHYSAIGPSETTESTAPPSLPLAVRLDQLELDDIRIQQGDDIQSISRVTLSAKTKDATLDITRFQISYDAYQAEGEGHLELAGHYPLQMTIRWQGELPEIGAASGAGQIGGDLNRVTIEHATEAPFRISTQGHIDLSGASPVIDINGAWQPLAWPPQAVVVQSSGGHYRLQGSLEALHLSSEAQLLFPDTDTPPLNARLDTRLSTSRLDDLSLIVREISDRSEPLELQIRGAVSFDTDEPQLDLSGEWSHVRWPLLSDPTSESPAGTFRLKGPAQQPRLESQASLTFPQPDVPDIQAHLQGLVSADSLSDITLDSELLNGKIRTTGNLTWAPAVDWNLVIQGESLDPSTQWPEWPGKLALQAALQGGVSEQGLWLAADLQQLSGTLQQQPISATGRGRYDPTGLNLETLQLQSGPNRLDLHGMLGDRLDLQYALKAPDLAAFWPALQGNIQADGRLGGVRDNPELSASLQASGLNYGEQQIEQMTGDLTWAKSEARGKLTAKGLKSGDWQGRQLSLTISGTPEAHQARLTLDATDLQLTTAVQGGWSAPLWRGQLERLTIEHAQFGNWRTDGPAAMLAGGDQFSLEPTCLIQQNARLCADGAWTPASSRIAANLTAIPLTRLLLWLPEEVKVEGSIDGKLQLSGPLQALTGEAQLTLPQGSLLLEPADEQPLRLALQEGVMNLQMTPQGNRLDFKLKAGEGVMAAQARTAPFSSDGPLAVTGTLKAEIPDLQPLGLLLPGLSNIHGRLTAEAAIRGHLEQPEIEGFIRLSDGAANVPQLGLALEGIQLSARNQGSERVTLEGELTSGGGALGLQGDLRLDAEQDWPLTLKLKGKDIQVVRLPEAEAYASPDLDISLRKRQLNIKGDLKLPKVDIELRELPKSAVGVSEDEVIIGKTESLPKPSPLKIDAQVTVQVGEQVRFNGFGLKTRLQGNVALNSRDGRTLAQGELALKEGRYRAYGQDLTIEQGRLLFNGPPQNPNLDIKATRLSKDRSVTAILNLNGNLRNPQVQVSSSPSLPEEEALAYLITGQGMAEEGPGSAAMLRQAVAAKGLEKSQEILDRLAVGLGVDEVRLEEGASLEETSLLLGKYLSPDLYVSYAVGLFDNRGALITRYRLSEKLRLEVQSGSSQSMDLIYDVER